MPHPPLSRVNGILYGGDYNPEQWSPEVWRDDIRLMRQARVNFVSVGIFSWAWLEPRPGVFEFEWLDQVLDLLSDAGIHVNLATATASPPAWLSRMHPESLPVRADGSRLRQGARQHYAPFSPAFRYYAERLVRRIARRYARHPALASWHVNNEYACHVSESFDDATVQGFRHWLEQRYGSIGTLNEVWGTAFWSQRYACFAEIGPPGHLPTFANPAQALDWRRFSNAVLLDLCRMEIVAIRDYSPDVPINTNFLGFAPALDGFEWARLLDYASWDSYPDPFEGHSAVVGSAMTHDLTRSLKQKPFVLMEQATNQVNWRASNSAKAPGQMRALSYQALARGADGICFFQWRASKAGAEKFHSAMVPHTPPEKSRVFQEVTALGQELSCLSSIVGADTPADVAFVFDWTSRWALLERGRPAAIDPVAECRHWYEQLHAKNVAVDFVPAGADLSRYRLVIAPALYLLDDAGAEALIAFTRGGGQLVVTFFTGIVNEHEQVGLGGYPAKLRDLLGIWVEEWHVLGSEQPQSIRWRSDVESIAVPREAMLSEAMPVEYWSELMHLNGAECIAEFGAGSLAGKPAITAHAQGSGRAYYVATRLSTTAQNRFMEALLKESKVKGVLETPPLVEACVRRGERGRTLFLINHSEQAREVNLDQSGRDLCTGERCGGVVALEPQGVAVIELAD